MFSNEKVVRMFVIPENGPMEAIGVFQYDEVWDVGVALHEDGKTVAFVDEEGTAFRLDWTHDAEVRDKQVLAKVVKLERKMDTAGTLYAVRETTPGHFSKNAIHRVSSLQHATQCYLALERDERWPEGCDAHIYHENGTAFRMGQNENDWSVLSTKKEVPVAPPQPSDPLTFAKARMLLPEGYTMTRKDGEYRVGRKGSSEAERYYTDNLQDAVETARAMFKSTKTKKRGRVTVDIAEALRDVLMQLEQRVSIKEAKDMHSIQQARKALQRLDEVAQSKIDLVTTEDEGREVALVDNESGEVYIRLSY